MTRPEYSPGAVVAQKDDLDALFETSRGIDDIFDEIRRDVGSDDASVAPDLRKAPKEKTQSGQSHDIDDEIKITKKRAPIAKLDDKRLLSEAGIPKLQKISKARMRFKRKGHEFSDVARLLRTYQLWLDDLYPRAKFADGLAIIEKLGHSKRMQVQRKAWINQGRPDYAADEDDMREREASALAVADEPEDLVDVANDAASTDNNLNEPKFRQTSDARVVPASTNDPQNGGPDDDELDALLAGEESNQILITDLNRTGSKRPDGSGAAHEPAYDDEEEAMRELQDMDELW